MSQLTILQCELEVGTRVLERLTGQQKSSPELVRPELPGVVKTSCIVWRPTGLTR